MKSIDPMIADPMNINTGRKINTKRSTPIRFRQVLSVCLSLGICAAVSAEQPDERARALFVLEPIFDLLDCTQQGHIEGGEVDEHFFSLFAPYDPGRKQWAPRSSFVTAKDPGARLMQEAVFVAMDTNGDEKVSTLEFRDQIMHLIGVADGNGDGEVTLEELRAAPAGD